MVADIRNDLLSWHSGVQPRLELRPLEWSSRLARVVLERLTVAGYGEYRITNLDGPDIRKRLRYERVASSGRLIKVACRESTFPWRRSAYDVVSTESLGSSIALVET